MEAISILGTILLLLLGVRLVVVLWKGKREINFKILVLGDEQPSAKEVNTINREFEAY